MIASIYGKASAFLQKQPFVGRFSAKVFPCKICEMFCKNFLQNTFERILLGLRSCQNVFWTSNNPWTYPDTEAVTQMWSLKNMFRKILRKHLRWSLFVSKVASLKINCKCFLWIVKFFRTLFCRTLVEGCFMLLDAS